MKLEKTQNICYFIQRTKGDIVNMIVYYKLDSLLEERHITKKKLGEETGLSTNIISKISKNEGFKTETINRLCEFLKVQPGDIMEWIPDKEYTKSYEKN